MTYPPHQNGQNPKNTDKIFLKTDKTPKKRTKRF